jgi:PAS domain S-box-containing protein
MKPAGTRAEKGMTGGLVPSAVRWRVRLAALLVVLATPAPGWTAVPPSPELTTIKRILTSGSEARDRAFRIRGVVTVNNSSRGLFFVQDDTAGIHLVSPSEQRQVRPGDYVEVEGHATSAHFGIKFVLQKITSLGRAPLPVPLRVPWSQIRTGMKDSQWVEVKGVVRQVDTREKGTVLHLASGNERIRVHVSGIESEAEAGRLVDSELAVRGVCDATLNDAGQFVGAAIYVPDAGLLKVERPAPSSPYETPPVPIAKILGYQPGESGEHRVHVQGTVQLHRPGRSLFLTNAGENLYVESADQTALRPGDLIDVLGFPDFIQGSPALSDASYRLLRSEPAPAPVLMTVKEALDPRQDSALISIDARLVESAFTVDQYTLLLQAAGMTFEAILDCRQAPAKLAALDPGTSLRASGIGIQFRRDDGTPYGMKLRLRDPSDVRVLGAAPWWNLRRAAMLAAIMATAIVAVLAWTISLRRRVLRQTEIIRERLDRESALEQRCRDLVENASDIICTTDLTGRLTSLNRSGERISGYGRDELIGLRLHGLLTPESLERLVAILGRAHETREFPFQEGAIVCKDGRTVFLEVGVRVIEDQGSPAGLELIARDVTERRRAEQERRALADQLRQSQKIEAIGQLAGGVAHDFNNLLTVINGYSDLLLSRFDRLDPRRMDLEHIREAGGRAASLTAQLLAFSRRQILRPTVLDLNEAAAVAARILNRLIGENIILTIESGTGPCRFMADPVQVQQVIMNLAINARDAMPEGGQLTIETTNVVLDERFVREHAEGNPGPHVMLAIKDTGTGMDDATKARIFEPFFTTKGLGKGTGLGLSTVYGIVKQSGGLIWVDSAPGKGTVFRIYFPSAEIPHEAVTAECRDNTRREGCETILVAEDDFSVKGLVTRGLREQGYKVLDASTGPAALSTASAFPGTIHLLLTDVVMPEMSGATLASMIKTARPEIKVLFVSGHTDDSIVRHGVLGPRAAFLQKPFTTDTLARKVREVIDTAP